MTAPTALTRIITTLFGSAPAVPMRLGEPGIGAADSGQPQAKPVVTTQRANRPLARNAIVPDALRRAIEDFIADDARAYVAYYPRTRYRIDQIACHITPENRRYLEELQALKPRIRNGIALACITGAHGAAEVIDASGFCDWHIAPAPEASADDKDVYTVLAGQGPEQFNLNFTIFGEYVEADADTAPAAKGTPANAGKPTGRDSAATLDIGPLAAPLITLRICEPGQPERSQPIHKLPALIGRGSGCQVQIDSPYVSRIHACISRNAAGQWVIEGNSPKGTQIVNATGHATTLATGQAQALPKAGTLYLTPDAQALRVPIHFDCQAAAADDKATLDLPPGPPQPSPAHAHASAGSGSGAGAQPTLYARPTALARLWVRHGDGQTEEHLIHQLPVLIGREPDGDGLAIVLRDPKSLASRTHLRIEKRQGSSFLTDNLAAGKGNTWQGGELLGPRFAWRLQAPGARGGWVILGQRDESASAVMVRIECMP